MYQVLGWSSWLNEAGMPIVQVKSTNTLISNVRYKTLQCIRTWRLVLLFAFACCPLACLLAVRSACGSFARAPLSQPWRRKIFSPFQQQNQHHYSFWCERGLSLVENPKLPLIALHGGAAVAAAGINGISVYGVITPTLPMDKRCRWVLPHVAATRCCFYFSLFTFL